MNQIALGLLTSLLFVSCEDQPAQGRTQSAEPTAPSQEVNTGDILPFSYSLQSVGISAENLDFRLKVSEGEIQAVMLNGSEVLHSTTFPLELEDLQQALAKLQKSDLIPEQSPSIHAPVRGIAESLETSFGKWSFYRNEETPDQLLPASAANFQPLSDFATHWFKIATKEYRDKFIALATRERKIVEPIGEFVKVGMFRETLLSKFPDPDWETESMISYDDWNPALVSNATREGTFGITLRLEDGKVTSWSWSSK